MRVQSYDFLLKVRPMHSHFTQILTIFYSHPYYFTTTFLPF